MLHSTARLKFLICMYIINLLPQLRPLTDKVSLFLVVFHTWSVLTLKTLLSIQTDKHFLRTVRSLEHLAFLLRDQPVPQYNALHTCWVRFSCPLSFFFFFLSVSTAPYNLVQTYILRLLHYSASSSVHLDVLLCSTICKLLSTSLNVLYLSLLC